MKSIALDAVMRDRFMRVNVAVGAGPKSGGRRLRGVRQESWV
jgi:hypothetical protein